MGESHVNMTITLDGVIQATLGMSPRVGPRQEPVPEGAAASRFEQVEPARSYSAAMVHLRYRCLGGSPQT